MYPYAIPVRIDDEIHDELDEEITKEINRKEINTKEIEKNDSNNNHYKKHYSIFLKKQNEILLDLSKYEQKWRDTLLQSIEKAALNGDYDVKFDIFIFVLNFRFTESQLMSYFTEIFKKYLEENNIQYKENKENIIYNFNKLDSYGEIKINILIKDFFVFNQ